MPQVIDFKAFATGGGANVQTQSEFASAATTTQGFQTGTAVSSHVNKVWRQSAFWGCVLATFVSNQLTIDVLDDGNVSGKITNFQNAILQLTNIYAPLASPALTGSPTAPTQTGTDNSTKIATTAFVKTALAGYAVLASPAFTGTPTAPTPAAADNSTKIATTAFVTTALAGYAKLASPAFTGTPTGPTAASGTNNTQLATTAFVQTAVTSAGIAFADQAAMEAAASTSSIVSPGRQIFHPGAAKAWISFTVSGSILSIQQAYNCTANRISNGIYHVTFQGITFSNAFYVAVPSSSDNTSSSGDGANLRIPQPFNRTTVGCDFKTEGGGGGLNEPALFTVAFFGDLA